MLAFPVEGSVLMLFTRILHATPLPSKFAMVYWPPALSLATSVDAAYELPSPPALTTVT
jgi:hypothetical protein